MKQLWLATALACTAPLTAQGFDLGQRPKLVVLISVDQLAEWVFELGNDFYAKDGGFRRLQQQGVTFAQCAFEHACTETGPGHATISTGAPASRHGIVKNNWWSRDTRTKSYCVGDAVEALPELPRGANRGPSNLTAPTFSTSIKAHIPGSKVASVSWKDRSAVLMAGRDADAVAWIETATGNLTTNKVWANELPAWIAKFNKDRVIDSFHGKVWERTGPQAAYEGLVDERRFEWVHPNGSLSRSLPQPLTGGKVEPDIAFYNQIYMSPFGNTVIRHAAEAAIDGLELGADDATDLLCVSFSCTDVVGHYFGPGSVEARDALFRLDRDLGLLFDKLDAAAGKGRWAAFLTADHGVAPVPEAVIPNGVSAGRGPLDAWVASAVERRLRTVYGELNNGARYVAHVGEGGVFLDRELLKKQGRSGALRGMAREAADAASKVRGLSAAYATQDLLERDAKGDPILAALQKAAYPGRTGDVLLVIKPYWLNGATPASHGSPHSYDREVVGFAIGPGLPAGQKIATPITPGFGVVLFAEMLSIPKPSAAHEHVPAGLLKLR